MEKTIEVKVEDIKRVFDEANDNVRNCILNLFPQIKEDLQITDRVKTFEDACRELGEDHPFVLAYQNTNLRDPEVADDNKDVLAYLKLRIITAALNEGWTPQLVEDERRYYPFFHICSEEEIICMSEEEKSRVVYLSDCYASALVSVSFAYADYDTAVVYADIASLLAFKTEELAEYAGKQFIDLWTDFCFTKKK